MYPASGHRDVYDYCTSGLSLHFLALQNPHLHLKESPPSPADRQPGEVGWALVLDPGPPALGPICIFPGQMIPSLLVRLSGNAGQVPG